MWVVGWTVCRWVDCNIMSNVRYCVACLSQIFQRFVPYDIFHWFPASGWTRNFRLDYIELPWVSLKIKNLMFKIDSWVCWARVVILSFMPASYVDEFYDHVPGYRVSWPRVTNYESAGHVIKCRVCWPRANNDESAGRVIKCRVCWPRAKNDESAGHVPK